MTIINNTAESIVTAITVDAFNNQEQMYRVLLYVLLLPSRPIQTDVIFQLRWAKWINNHIVATTRFIFLIKTGKGKKVEKMQNFATLEYEQSIWGGWSCSWTFPAHLVLLSHLWWGWIKVILCKGFSCLADIESALWSFATLSQLRLKAVSPQLIWWLAFCRQLWSEKHE